VQQRQTNTWATQILKPIGKWTIALTLAISIMPISPNLTTYAAEPVLELKQEETLTAGATLKSYVWKTDRKGQEVSVHANVVQIDLQNPYVKLDAMTGTGGQYTKKQTVMGMAAETGAVAGVNGDFYNTQAEGVPIGPQITDGKLMATPPYLPGFYSFAVTKDRKPIVDLFTFQGKIISKDGSTYPLGGINKTYYWFEPSGRHSMIDGLFMYTNAWGQEDRSNDGVTSPTEVLVVNNVVVQIVQDDILHMVAPKDGYILRSAGKAAEFVMKHMKVGDTIKVDYTLLPLDPTKTYDYKSFQMMIGGHTIMVDEGKPAEFSREVASLAGYRSRTAIGYSKDQRYIYLITADNSGDSKGLSMSELQTFMIQVGVWKGMNLDGGGSTQMVARPQWETGLQLINATEYGSERKVVNGLGVYSLAPKGQVKSIKIEGPEVLFVGETVEFSLKGLDEYYNPVAEKDIHPIWQTSAALQQTGDNTFKALQKGKLSLQVKAGAANVTKELQIVGREDLTELKVEAFPAILREGETITLKATALTRLGVRREIPAELLKWDIRGIKGTVSGNQLRVDSLNGAKQGHLIARFDGYSSMAALSVGVTNLFADFDQKSYPVSFASTDGVSGRIVSRVTSQAYKDGYFTRLGYDFSNASGTKAAYAVFGNKDVIVPGEPQAIQLNVKGDNSLNWLRAEFIDGDGDVNRVDLAKTINWSGWRTITADLTAHHMTYPIKLTRIYVASVEQGQDERNLTGTIDLDQISFQYKGEVPALPRNKVSLIIDNPSIRVNGAAQAIDQAPVIEAGNTLVPVRFVAEALGALVEWDQDERKATIIRGGKMMEFRIGDKDYLTDGIRRTAEVPPVFRNERTMVPLRVLSEYLGWQVGWNGQTRTVTLE
jgi:trimeric autotransporter adhesin